MKTKIIFILTLVLGSCSSDFTLEDNKQFKEITFNVSGSITETVSTRASVALSRSSLTDLWIWEGTNLLAHKISTDLDFGSPTIKLFYGEHNLTFVASKADGQSWSNGVWSTTKEWDTFVNSEKIVVDGNSSRSHQTVLSRRTSRIKFQTTDNVPGTVKTMHLTVQNHKSLNSELIGGDQYKHEATVDITGEIGKTYSVFVNILTESPENEENCPVKIEFLDSNDKVLFHYERTVSLKPNRSVTLTGNYFTEPSSSISISSTEWETVDQSLFAE